MSEVERGYQVPESGALAEAVARDTIVPAHRAPAALAVRPGAPEHRARVFRAEGMPAGEAEACRTVEVDREPLARYPVP